MPETRWTVRWPDGREEDLYSPSTVVAEHFTPGESYPLADFRARARVALQCASDRVAAKYGFACTSALAQLDRIEARVAAFASPADSPVEGATPGRVTCLAITPQGPST